MKSEKSLRAQEQFIIHQEMALIIAITVAMTISILFVSLWVLGIAILLLIPLGIYDLAMVNLKYFINRNKNVISCIKASISKYRKISQYLFFTGAVFLVIGITALQGFLMMFAFLFFLLGFIQRVKVMNLGQMELIQNMLEVNKKWESKKK